MNLTPGTSEDAQNAAKYLTPLEMRSYMRANHRDAAIMLMCENPWVETDTGIEKHYCALSTFFGLNQIAYAEALEMTKTMMLNGEIFSGGGAAPYFKLKLLPAKYRRKQ